MTVINHLIRAGESSPIFRRFVNLLSEKLLWALFRRSDLSGEEKVNLLISWFNAGVRRQWNKPSVGLSPALTAVQPSAQLLLRPYIPNEALHMFYSWGTSVLLSTSYKEYKGHASTLIHKFVYIMLNGA